MAANLLISAPRLRGRLAMRRLGVRRLGRRAFVFIQIAIRLDGALQYQQPVGGSATLGVLVLGRQRHIVHGQDHHAGQRSHAADERTELVIRAHHAQLDRFFRVEVLRRLRTRLEQLGLQARGKCCLRDIDQQFGHLGLAGQLAQQLAQHVLHFVQLLLERFEIDRLGLLLGELLLELVFLGDGRLQLILLVADEEIPAGKHDQDDQQAGEEHLYRFGPATDVVAIEALQFLEEFHYLAPPLAAGVGTAGLAGATAVAALAGWTTLEAAGCGAAELAAAGP